MRASLIHVRTCMYMYTYVLYKPCMYYVCIVDCILKWPLLMMAMSLERAQSKYFTPRYIYMSVPHSLTLPPLSPLSLFLFSSTLTTPLSKVKVVCSDSSDVRVCDESRIPTRRGTVMTSPCSTVTLHSRHPSYGGENVSAIYSTRKNHFN